MHKEFTMYESWNVQPPSIPERSRLYQLEPIGLGTPSVESLISYVSRLAEAYCVPTGLLIVNEIAPLMKAEYTFGDKEGGLDRIFANQTRALNGMGNWSKSLVQALESLTLRTNLRSLTMLPWAEVIPQKSLLKPTRAWCPNCYGDSQIAEQPLYEPLLWSFSCVEVCLHHQQPLHSLCPTCQKPNRPLAWLSRPGYCSKCREWLGSYRKLEAAQSWEITESAWAWHAWVANNIGDLTASASREPITPSREAIALTLAGYARTLFEGNISAFSRWLGLGRVQTHRWVTGESAPELKTLLKICFRLEVPLLKIFNQAIANTCLAKEAKQPLEQTKVASSSSLNLQVEEVSKQIRQMKAALTEDPPPSLAKVAERLGYRRTTTLYYYASDMCHAISAKHTEYQKVVELKNIRCALEAVIANDVCPPPSLQKVAQSISTSVHTLKKHFPELCCSISSRYASYLSECRVKRIQLLKEEIRQVAAKLEDQGIEPTASRVSLYLNKPRSILQKEAKAALKEVRYELGWGK